MINARLVLSASLPGNISETNVKRPKARRPVLIPKQVRLWPIVTYCAAARTRLVAGRLTVHENSRHLEVDRRGPAPVEVCEQWLLASPRIRKPAVYAGGFLLSGALLGVCAHARRLKPSASNTDRVAPIPMLSRSGTAGDHSQLLSTLF
jgi:hypothetical protein